MKNRNILHAEAMLAYCRAFAGKKAEIVFASWASRAETAKALMDEIAACGDVDWNTGKITFPNGSTLKMSVPMSAQHSADLIWLEETI